MNGALTEEEVGERSSPASSRDASGATSGFAPASSSVSATTAEPGVAPVRDASRGPTNGKPAGPSGLVALNYLRGME